MSVGYFLQQVHLNPGISPVSLKNRPKFELGNIIYWSMFYIAQPIYIISQCIYENWCSKLSLFQKVFVFVFIDCGLVTPYINV